MRHDFRLHPMSTVVGRWACVLHIALIMSPGTAFLVVSLFAVSVEVILSAPPEFVEDPSKISSDGRVYIPPSGYGDLSVVCSTKEKANITWSANPSSDLSVLNITQTTEKTSVLFEKDVVQNQNARGALLGPSFTCTAVNDAGEMTTTDPFEFRLGRLPTINEAPSNVTEQEGNEVTLECSYATGLPIPEIFWKFMAKGSNVAVDTGPPSNDAFANDLSLMSIQRDKAGTYTCFVENQFQTLSAKAVVVVTYKPTVTINFSPSFRVKDQATATVTCRSDSLPLATVHSLTKNGVPIPENSPTKDPSSTPTETIIEWSYVITGSNETEGKYVCAANNTVGSGRSSEEELVVLLPPEAPTIVAPDAFDVCWSAGFLGRPPISNLSVSCTSKANGACSKKPAEFNSEVPVTNFTTVNNIRGVLCTTVSGPSADYTCTISANNGAFNENTATDVSTRPGKPGPVQISDVINVINTGFTLSWCVEFSGSTDPLTSAIIGEVSDDKATHSYDAQTQQGSTVLTGLEPNTEYKLQIRVTNSLGEAVSNERTQRTTCVPDVLNVTDAKATIDNLGEVTITFTDPRTGPCNSNNDYVIRNGDNIWATLRGERGQDNIVTITFERDTVSDQESMLTIATKNGDNESQRSASVSLPPPPGTTPDPVGNNPTTDEPEFCREDHSHAGFISAIAVLCVVILALVIVIVVLSCRRKSSKTFKLEGNRQQAAGEAGYESVDFPAGEKSVSMTKSRIYGMAGL